MTFTMFVIEDGEGDEEFGPGVRRRYANVLEEEEFESEGEFDGGELDGGTNDVPQEEEELDPEPQPWDPSDNFFSLI